MNPEGRRWRRQFSKRELRWAAKYRSLCSTATMLENLFDLQESWVHTDHELVAEETRKLAVKLRRRAENISELYPWVLTWDPEEESIDL